MKYTTKTVYEPNPNSPKDARLWVEIHLEGCATPLRQLIASGPAKSVKAYADGEIDFQTFSGDIMSRRAG